LSPFWAHFWDHALCSENYQNGVLQNAYQVLKGKRSSWTSWMTQPSTAAKLDGCRFFLRH